MTIMAELTDNVEESDGSSRDVVVKEFGWWGAGLGWLVGVFALTGTITNMLHGIFHFELLPIFENSLQGFRAWTYWIVDTLFLSWMLSALEQFWYACQVIASNIFDLTPVLFKIVVPDWYRDLALISAVLSAASSRASDATSVGPRRTTLERAFPAESRQEMRRNLGPLYAIFWAIVLLQDMLARISFVVSYVVVSPVLAVNSRLANALFRPLYHMLEGVTQAGLLEALVNNTEWMVGEPTPADRRWIAWQYFTLVVALAASAAFFFWNGFAMDIY
jgi:hypothetical protein